MKVAVIGGGIAGIATAQGIAPIADVTLFEAQSRLGGHADTHNLLIDGQSFAVDTGFSVFNGTHYPQLVSWLDSLGIVTRPCDTSLGVTLDRAAPELSNLEYGTRDLSDLFCQRKNLLNVRFLKMAADIIRFQRDARKQVAERPGVQNGPALAQNVGLTLGEYLASARFSAGFEQDYLLPICSALWSLSTERVLALPLPYVCAFLAAHNMLKLNGVEGWLTICGGANAYVSRFIDGFQGELRLGTPVQQVERKPGFVRVHTDSSEQRFDQVVFACDAPAVLGMIEPTPQEREVLGSFSYQPHRAVVHSDSAWMPQNPRAWSSWNVKGSSSGPYQMTTWANQVQSFGRRQQLFVTLNPEQEPAQIWAERTYRHPVITPGAILAQQRRRELNGQHNSYFCGAYWGLGLHEDGFVSGMDVVTALSAAAQVAA